MPTQYEQIRTDLHTGDIVLFSGNRAISTVIRLSTMSRWSHVGMVVRLEDQDFVSVWESTKRGTGLPDLDSGQIRKGVQLTPLRDRVRTYPGRVSVRQLKEANLEAEDYEELWRLRKELGDRPYEKDRLELIKAAYDGPFGQNAEDLDSIFCSELVAEAYQSLGLLAESKPSNEYVSADFSASRKLQLLKGRLGDEIELRI